MGGCSPSAWVLLVLGLSGCGVVTIGGKPLGGPSEGSSSSAEASSSEPAAKSEWRSVAGEWDTSYGAMTIVETEKNFVGTYPSGKLECTWDGTRYNEYKCQYADSDGSGAATIFHDGEGLRGQWKDKKGEIQWWRFCKGKCGELVTYSSNDVSVTLENQCGQDVPVCIDAPPAPYTTQIPAKKYSLKSLPVGTQIRSKSGGSCGEAIAVVAASTSKVLVCK